MPLLKRAAKEEHPGKQIGADVMWEPALASRYPARAAHVMYDILQQCCLAQPAAIAARPLKLPSPRWVAKYKSARPKRPTTLKSGPIQSV